MLSATGRQMRLVYLCYAARRHRLLSKVCKHVLQCAPACTRHVKRGLLPAPLAGNVRTEPERESGGCCKSATAVLVDTLLAFQQTLLSVAF